MRLRDVLIHTVSPDRDPEHFRDFPPIQERVDLSEQLWIGPLDDNLSKSVIDACDKRYLGPIPHVRESHHLYSYVRELSRSDCMWNWDDDHLLEATVAISRLVHPTSAGLLCAARIVFDESGGIDQIYPAVRNGISTEVFLSPQRIRDWLTLEDAYVLKELAPRHPLSLPERVHNAYWHHEYAARTYYINHRWSFICTGLEALTHTDKWHSTRQFAKRVPALAAELGIALSEDQAADIYDARSRLAHGLSLLAKGPGSPSASQVEAYDLIEDILRLAVLRSMRDPTFANIFRDDDSIRTRWPA